MRRDGFRAGDTAEEKPKDHAMIIRPFFTGASITAIVLALSPTDGGLPAWEWLATSAVFALLAIAWRPTK